jgi:hypothetical protein
VLSIEGEVPLLRFEVVHSDRDQYRSEWAEFGRYLSNLRAEYADYPRGREYQQEGTSHEMLYSGSTAASRFARLHLVFPPVTVV